ncbi:hypothetical protein BLOT_006954 [Blomia tropicalis]|nr:hypothetical protein BLOT_006954 [Blomia tropicalis]
MLAITRELAMFSPVDFEWIILDDTTQKISRQVPNMAAVQQIQISEYNEIVLGSEIERNRAIMPTESIGYITLYQFFGANNNGNNPFCDLNLNLYIIYFHTEESRVERV